MTLEHGEEGRADPVKKVKAECGIFSVLSVSFSLAYSICTLSVGLKCWGDDNLTAETGFLYMVITSGLLWANTHGTIAIYLLANIKDRTLVESLTLYFLVTKILILYGIAWTAFAASSDSTLLQELSSDDDEGGSSTMVLLLATPLAIWSSVYGTIVTILSFVLIRNIRERKSILGLGPHGGSDRTMIQLVIEKY